MERKTILHFIYNLGRGGAETMLVQVLKELKEFNNIVVTLEKTNHFQNEFNDDKYFCLNKPSLFTIIAASKQLKEIIKDYKVDLVHSHLPQPNFIARLATPKNIPLVTTIHTSIATAIDYKKKYIRLLDKFTYNFRSSTILGVSNKALQDYFSVLKIKPGKHEVLYTFVDLKNYKDLERLLETQPFKIISVGSLREAKNYFYLLETFKILKNKNIELHIYGAGPLKDDLQQKIDEEQLPVILKGQTENINLVLPQYNLFIMSSLFEGFSLSVLEAMAAKVPLLLSDIPSFREQAEETAVYFNLDNTQDFIEKILSLKNNPAQMEEMAKLAYDRVTGRFTIQHHIQQLRQIYNHEFLGY